jgi:hypothetical protein
MYLYGDEWGKAANVDALGLANQKVVKKLTIFADDILVKQYLQDVMGADFDPEQVFAPRATVLNDSDSGVEPPQNAARMERELAAQRAAAAAAAGTRCANMCNVSK